jgi:hypothetical protein
MGIEDLTMIGVAGPERYYRQPYGAWNLLVPVMVFIHEKVTRVGDSILGIERTLCAEDGELSVRAHPFKR